MVRVESRDLAAGQHLCWVVDGAEAQTRAASWARDGLLREERVVYVKRPGGLGAFLSRLEDHGVDWRRRVGAGQLVLLSVEEAYLGGGAFDPERAVTEHGRLVSQSLDEGYTGVRLSSEAGAALSILRDLDALLAYEAGIETLCRTDPFSALCFCDRQVVGAHCVPFANAHPRGVGDEMVEIRAEPGRVWLAGEVDISNSDLVGSVLAAAKGNEGELVIDLTDLAFIDVGAAGRLAQLPRRLGPGHHVRVVRPPSQLMTILQVLEWDHELDLTDSKAAR